MILCLSSSALEMASAGVANRGRDLPFVAQKAAARYRDGAPPPADERRGPRLRFVRSCLRSAFEAAGSLRRQRAKDSVTRSLLTMRSHAGRRFRLQLKNSVGDWLRPASAASEAARTPSGATTIPAEARHGAAMRPAARSFDIRLGDVGELLAASVDLGRSGCSRRRGEQALEFVGTPQRRTGNCRGGEPIFGVDGMKSSFGFRAATGANFGARMVLCAAAGGWL